MILLAAPLARAGELGPDIGSAIPHPLTTVDQDGAAQSFASLRGDKGLVLMFVRSAGWCPFCQRQMIEMQASADQIEAKGYKLAALSYDTPQTLRAFARKRGIGYAMLSDEGSEIIKAFGILNDTIEPGSRAYGIPHPIIFVIDADGVITAKLYEESYRDRPPAEAVVEKL